MAFFLKAVSGIYLFFVWASCAMAIAHPTPLSASVGGESAANVLIVMLCIGLSIPAVALFGFAQIVGDVRAIRNSARLHGDHLAAMRRYYEPQR